MIFKKYIPYFCVPLLLCCSTFHAYSKETIKVGLAHFPPFIENHEDTVGGLVADMLELMNQHQDKYQFVALPTLPTTRHKLFELGRYDMSMFDSLEWGWKGLDVDQSEVYLTGGEIYIAQNVGGRDESYFESFDGKTMVGILGYHYGFAGFNNDADYLSSNFNMILTKSNLGSINMILAGNRGDIAVVTKSFLARYLLNNPDQRSKLLISKKEDQQYKHRIIIRRGISPSVQEIDQILSELDANGKLPALWKTIDFQPLHKSPAYK